MPRVVWPIAVALAASGWIAEADAYEGIVEKKVFAMPEYTTTGGETIKHVKIGWEAYGELNEAKDNVILITHFFSGTSHAAGRYAADDAAPGYWDYLIGPGKPIDTDQFYYTVQSRRALARLPAGPPQSHSNRLEWQRPAPLGHGPGAHRRPNAIPRWCERPDLCTRAIKMAGSRPPAWSRLAR